MFKWTPITIICATALLAAAVACGGGGEKTIDPGNGDKVKISTDLPDNFPDNFPIYEGADLQGAAEGEQEGISGIVATWTTGDDFDDVKAFYDDGFEGGAWQSIGSGNAGGSAFWSLDESDGDRVGYLAVSDADPVSIIATVGDDPNAAAGSDGDSDAVDESPADGDSSGDSGSSGGQSELPNEVDLPNDFPSDRVPLPDNARLVTASSVSSDGQQYFALALYTKDSIDDAAQSYQEKLEGKGYSQSFESSDANGAFATYSENSDGTGVIIGVTISEGDVEGYRLVTLSVTDSGS